MIQGLGTLRMLSDISQDRVLEGFKFTQFENLEEADDKGEFYQEIQKENPEEKIVKTKFNKYFLDLNKYVSWIYIFNFLI